MMDGTGAEETHVDTGTEACNQLHTIGNWSDRFTPKAVLFNKSPHKVESISTRKHFGQGLQSVDGSASNQ